MISEIGHPFLTCGGVYEWDVGGGGGQSSLNQFEVVNAFGMSLCDWVFADHMDVRVQLRDGESSKPPGRGAATEAPPVGVGGGGSSSGASGGAVKKEEYVRIKQVERVGELRAQLKEEEE